MAWGKAGSTTLASADDDLDITSMTANKFNQILYHTIASGATDGRITYNNNANSVYARRGSNNGGTDFTGTSTAYIESTHTTTTDKFSVSYLCSISGEEKLQILHYLDYGTAGAGTAPNRLKFVFKFVPSPDADITRIDMNNTQSGSFDTSSNLTALGSDMTPASAIPFPTNVQVGSRAEITDTRKMYDYGDHPTFEDDFSSDNWTDSGTNPQVTGGEMVWSVNSAVDANSYYDLGSPISNNSWVLRCKITINNYTLNTDGTGQEFSFGLSNETTIPTNSKDAIVFRLRTGSSTAQYQLIDVDGGSLSGGAASQAFTRTLSAETIYVELIRTSTTTYKANIYSDSAYSVLLESQTTTCPSTITDLQYINFYSLENDGTSNGVLDGICDDIEFYDGVVTPSNSWKEIGT